MSDFGSYDATSRRIDVDGRSLHYHEAGEGPPLVLLHGSGPGVSGWANFGRNLPVLAEHLRCLVLDQPGFGGSERQTPFPKNYLRVSAEALLGFLDAMGLEKVHLLGNSMGGDVAVRFTLDNPDRVDRLVLLGPGGTAAPILGPSPSEGIKRLMDFNLDPTRDRMEAWVRTMVSDQALVTTELVDERMANAEQPGAVQVLQDAYTTFFDPAMAEAVPLFAEVHRIRARTLICWGRDDRVAPVEGALLPARRMPRADLMIFSRCGHWVQIERKDDFERAVLGHLL